MTATDPAANDDTACGDDASCDCATGDGPAQHKAAVNDGVVKRVLLKLIRLYQATSSVRQPRCRYFPTCSHYAAEAIEVHGARRGTWLAVRRLSRCQPFGSFGFDPVPEK